MNAKDEKKKPGKEQVPDDKPGPEAEGHENDKVIILPEHLPEHKHRRFRRAQDTVGMKTPRTAPQRRHERSCRAQGAQGRYGAPQRGLRLLRVGGGLQQVFFRRKVVCRMDLLRHLLGPLVLSLHRKGGMGD